MAKTLTHKLVFRPREVSEFYDLVKDPRTLTNLWGKPEVGGAQQTMLDGLLKWYQETTDVAPLAEGAIHFAGRVLRRFRPDGRQRALVFVSVSANVVVMNRNVQCLAADDVGYPANHSGNHTGPPDKELWWQRFNPAIHPDLQTMTVDGNPIEGE